MKAVPGIRLFNIHFDFTIGECIRVYILRVAITLQEWVHHKDRLLTQKFGMILKSVYHVLAKKEREFLFGEPRCCLSAGTRICGAVNNARLPSLRRS